MTTIGSPSSRRRALRDALGRLPRDVSGVALLEFAYIVPVFLLLAVTGTEIANFITTKMRISQVALHLADHAARMGNGSQLSAKTITETNINDVLTGAGLQADELKLFENGRVVLSSLEPVATPNPTERFRIAWQRCRGSQSSYAPRFGAAGATNLVGMGPNDRQVKAPDGGATMFVEVYYKYQPIFGRKWAPSMEMRDIASMAVRDRRDLSAIYNAEAAPVARC